MGVRNVATALEREVVLASDQGNFSSHCVKSTSKPQSGEAQM